MNKWWAKAILPFATVALLTASACSAGGKAKLVDQVKIGTGDLVMKVSGTGKISYGNDADLAFGSSGRVQKIYVKKSDKVAKGQVLAQLDMVPLELATLRAEDALAKAQTALKDAQEPYKEVDKTIAQGEEAAAEARLSAAVNVYAGEPYSLTKWAAVKQAEADLARAKDSLQKILDGPDKDDLAAAERQVKIAQANLDDAKRQKNEATISAPFDGIVASLDAKEGDIVSVAKPIVHLVDPTSLEVSAEIDEIDMVKVKLYQKAVVTLDALPETALEGAVTEIPLLPVAKPQNSGVVVYAVDVTFANPSPDVVKAGMSASIDIITGELKNVILVPNKALKRNSAGNTFVQVQVDASGKTEERAVVLGATDGVSTEVISGLKAGETVMKERSS